jgi:hypothetical protein
VARISSPATSRVAPITAPPTIEQVPFPAPSSLRRWEIPDEFRTTLLPLVNDATPFPMVRRRPWLVTGTCLVLTTLALAVPVAAQDWSLISQAGPAPRVHHAMAYDSVRDRVVLHGGIQYGPPYVELDDTWEFDGTQWSLVAATSPVGVRFTHAMAFDEARGECVLVGGQGYSPTYPYHLYPLPDTWTWNGQRWTYRGRVEPLRNAVGVNNHAMTYDSRRQQVLLFFGNAFIAWDGTSWSLLSNASEPWLPDYAKLAYDSTRDRVVLFGPRGGTGPSQTWEWDGASWALMSSTGPSPRNGHTLTYDQSRQRTILHGGFDRSLPGWARDTWEWDGRSWILISTAMALPSHEHTMVFDSRRERAVIFGGCEGIQRCEPLVATTWAYAPTVRHRIDILGGACGGTFPAPSLEIVGLPIIRSTAFSMNVVGALPGAFSFLGISALSRPGQVIGPCTIHPELPFHAFFWTQATAAGTAVFALPIPGDPGIVGAEAFAQAGAMAPQAPIAGLLALTDGIRILVGD